jgi:hypothetical protein
MSGSSSAKRGRDWHMTDDEKRLLERVRGMYGSTGKSPRGESRAGKTTASRCPQPTPLSIGINTIEVQLQFISS